MQLTVSKQGIPAGIYEAEYLGGEVIETAIGKAYSMRFKVIGGDFDGKITSRLVNHSASSPKSNVAQMFSALAGKTPAEGLTVNDEEYVGAKYQILVKAKENGYTQVAEIIRRLDTPEAQAAALNGAQVFGEETPF